MINPSLNYIKESLSVYFFSFSYINIFHYWQSLFLRQLSYFSPVNIKHFISKVGKGLDITNIVWIEKSFSENIEKFLNNN